MNDRSLNRPTKVEINNLRWFKLKKKQPHPGSNPQLSAPAVIQRVKVGSGQNACNGRLAPQDECSRRRTDF